MRSKGFKRIAIFLIVVLLFQLNSFVNYYPNLSDISYAESDTQCPSTPTNLVLLSKTTSSVDLAWDSSVDNIGVSGYEIYQDSVKVATVNGTNINFTGMAADTTYTFYVIAQDGAGNKSGPSNILNVTTDQTSLDQVKVTTSFNSEASSSSDSEAPSSSDSEAPFAPANLNFTSKTDTSINLIWDAATDNIGVIGYDIYKDSVNVASVSETSCNITELTPNTNYSFYVIAKDESGNQSIASNILNVTTDETSLTIPENLASSSLSSTSIEISWDAVLNATGYDIVVDGEIIDNGNSTYFVHNNLLPDSTHTYKIRAKNAAQTSNWSNEIQVTTSLDTQASAALTGPGISYQTSTGEGVPSNFIASATNANVMLSWDSVLGATSYTVLKNGTTEYNTASTAITISATPNTKYTFAVRSVNVSGTSDWSGNIEVWTLMNTPIGFSATSLKNSVSLSWGIVSGATSYEIEIDGQVYNNGTATTYLHSNINPNESHIYRVRAKNANTVSDWTAAITKAAVDYIALGGIISANRTLTPEEGPYGITSNLTVNQNVILTIMPGTLLRINPGVSISVNGKIVAQGTTDRKITFTSMKDVAFGGTGVISSSDCWYGIAISGTGDFNGDNLNIKYCYYNIAPRYALKIQGGKLNLTNSNLSDFYGYGIYLTGNVFSDVNIQGVTFDRVASSAIYMDSNTSSSGTLTVKNCIFNSTGIYLNDRGTTTITIENNQINNVNGNGININGLGSGILSINSNTVSGCNSYPIYARLYNLRSSCFGSINNNILSNNVLNSLSVNRVAFYGNPIIDISITNNNQEYIFESLYIDQGRTVTIDPGVKLFGIAGAPITITNGSKLKTLGTSENPIVFTSIKDERYGGIGLTNWAESWSGISLTNNAEFIADNTIIRYLYSNIYVSGAKLSLTNSELSKAKFDGILFSGSIMPTIMFNKFSDIGNAVIDTYDVVDARYNYWGSVYGPGYVTSASSSVITTPWLGSELKYQFKYGVEGINPATGNFSRNYTDLSVKSPGFDLNFGRTYNSLDDTQDLYFGRGWHFSFDSKVKDFKSKILMSDGTIKEYALSNIKNVTLPNGSVLTFNQNADGTFTANGSRSKLEKLEDGTYVLTTKDQYRYGYNSDGYLTWMKDRNDNTVSINLDTNNKITSITDQAERTYSVSYNAGGHIETITDSEGRTVNYEYEDGILVRAIDPEGNVSRYTYDSQNYLSEIRDHENNLVDLIVYNHTAGENQHRVSQVTNQYENVETYSYDNANKRTIITDSNDRQKTQYYDSACNNTQSIDYEGRTEIINYFLDGKGNNIYFEEKDVTDRNGNKTQYERDANGNITKVTNPDNSVKVMTYDDKNNLTSVKDENGKFTFYVYDDDNKNLIKKVQPLNGTDPYIGVDGANFAITHYDYYTDEECQQLGYKAKGLLESMTDPEGNVTTYAYDSDGNQETITNPNDKTTTYTYNSIGWLTEELSPSGNLTKYEYNANGNQIRRILDGGETYRTVYDSLKRKVKEISPNIYDITLDNLTDNTYSGDHGYRYVYHTNGLLNKQIDPENNETIYTYDNYGNILTETKPDGSIYRYTYDVMNRMTGIYYKESISASEILLEEDTYTVLANGKQQKSIRKYIDDTNSLLEVYTYDYAGRVLSKQNPDGTAQSTAYNANGTIATTTDTMGKVTTFKYDGLNRLSEQWIPFEYVSNNNRYTYTTFSYDKSGNKIQEKTGKDTVLLNGLPSQYISISNVYYPDGTLKLKTDREGRKTQYQYDDDGNLSCEDVYTNSSNYIRTEYINNYFGKSDMQTAYAQKGDIYGNSFTDSQEFGITTNYTYDKNGNIKTVTTHDGVVTTYTYDFLDRQTKVSQPGIDETGNAVNIEKSKSYDAMGRVDSETFENGTTTNYAYDGRGFLQKIVDANNGVTAFYYDRLGRKTAQVTPTNYNDSEDLSNLNRSEFTYDSMGRVKTISEIYLDPDSQQWISYISKAFKYDNNGNIIKELDALGYSFGSGITVDDKINNGYGTEYTYNLANKVLTILEPATKDQSASYNIKYTYNALGDKTSETNALGAITNYYYNDEGNLLAIKVKKDSSSPEQNVRTNTYDWVGNVVTSTDGNGNMTSYEYNAFGKVRKEEAPGDTSVASNITLYQYDVRGSLKSKENSTGLVDLYTYDNQGRELTQISKKSDGTQSILTSARYDKAGNKRFSTDGNNVTTEYVYDNLNRLMESKVAVTDANNNSIIQSTTYGYDANGNQTTNTDWLGNTYTNVYDPINRLIKKIDPLNVVIEKIEYNNNNSQIKSWDALNKLTQFTYDKNNRLLSKINPESNVESQTYDKAGNLKTKTDGKNNLTTFNYDEFNRLTSVANAKNETTSYTYDLNGNMLTQTDGKGNITTFEYNAVNKPLKRIDHGGRTGSAGSYIYDPLKVESYTYNPDGTLATKTDRNGNTTSYTYDVHGRVLSLSVGTIAISYSYDGNGNQLTLVDSTGTTARTYDELNRVKTKSVPNAGTMIFLYDQVSGLPQGHVKEVDTDTAGNVTTKEFDKAGRMIRVTANNQTTTYTYYDNGSKNTVTYPDGSSETYTYYDDGQLHTLINRKANGTIIDSYTYSYDAANNIASKVDSKGTTSYTYDTLNRLSTVNEPNTRSTAYTFDAAGNRLTETVNFSGITTVTTYTYNQQNRLTDVISKVGTTTTETINYSFDNNGNQKTMTTTPYIGGAAQTPEVTLFTFDMLNQLISETMPDSMVITNTYNGEGLRVGKDVNGQFTQYVYESGKVILELDGTGNQIARNVYGTNLISRTVNGTTLYYMYNGHADVTALLDSNGNIKGTYYYDAFGNLLESTGTVNNPFTYSGYQYDKETGLYYLQSRFYDPVIARFISEDTYRGNPNDPLSLNLYTYCHNEPLQYDDPNGHFAQIVIGGIIGAAVGAVSDIGYQVFGEHKSWKQINWRSVGKSALEGGVAGALFAGTFGASAAGGTALKLGANYFANSTGRIMVSAALSQAAGSSAAQAVFDKQINLYQVAQSSLMAAATAGVMSGVMSGVINKIKLPNPGASYVKTGNPIIDNLQKRLPNDEIIPPSKRGEKPISIKDDNPVEIHHVDQDPNKFQEMHPSDHRYGENYKNNHPDYNQPSKVDRKQFRKDNRGYWENEWDSGRWDDPNK